MPSVPCGGLAARTCALAGLCLLAAPAPARAWTSTELASADAHVHVWSSGQALVSLTLGLTVRGGWLSRFEVAGLEPGARLDPDKPPSVLCEDGRKVSPRAELRPDGTLVLEFDRTRAPRRGRHRLDVVYTTRLSSRDAGASERAMSWSMPAWRVDLADVDLWINAPADARLGTAEDAELEGAVSLRQLADGERTVLHLNRVQLPRTLPFGFELVLPTGARPPSSPRALPRDARGGQSPALWLGAAVIALAWLKRGAVRARCRRVGGRPVPLVALPPRIRGAAMLALGLAGALLYAPSPPLSLALLAAIVVLGFDVRIAPATPRLAPGLRPYAHAYELLGPPSWLDATTPPGALLLASAFALGLGRVLLGGGLGPWLELLLLVTPLWLTATRLHGPHRTSAAGAQRAAGMAPPSAPLSPTAGEDRRAPDRAA